MSRPAARTLSSSFRSIFRSSLPTPSGELSRRPRAAHPTGVVLVTDRHAHRDERARSPSAIDHPVRIRPGFARGAPRSGRPLPARPIFELDGPLGLDLDTPEDLLLVEAAAPERLGVA